MEILRKQISELNLSDRCKSYLEALNVTYLEDVMKIGWNGLLKGSQFDQLAFNELIRFLDANTILYMLDN